MRRLLLPVIFSLSLALTACNLFGAKPTAVLDASSSSSADSSDLVTHNVSYTGTIDALGVTTSMQGTHRLTLEGGQFLALESTDANLNLSAYLGKTVEVRGSLQPALEAGGMLLRVEEVIILGISDSSSSETSEGTEKMCGGVAGVPCEENEDCIDDPNDACDPAKGGTDCSGMCVPTSESSSSEISSSQSPTTRSSAPLTLSSSNSASSSSVPPDTSSSAASVPADSTAMEEQNVMLAKQVYDQDSLWTQKYCTSHIAFCIPVHKNWYYKSFGATTSNRWHVELGMSDIAELGDGAIILNLVSGSAASMQAQDGQIKAQGADVIGYKDWEDGTHFEMIADARLKAAVSYMLSHITPYPGAE